MTPERLAELRELAAKTQSAAGMECLAYIDELRAQLEAQRGGAVVVPEHVAWLRYQYGASGATWLQLCNSDDYGAFKVYRQLIPAPQALQPGQKVVDAKEFSLLSQHFQLWEKECDDQDVLGARLDVVFALNELYEQRNAKGGEVKG